MKSKYITTSILAIVLLLLPGTSVFGIILLLLMAIPIIVFRIEFSESSYGKISNTPALKVFFDKGLYGEFQTVKAVEGISDKERIVVNMYLEKSRAENETTEVDVVYINSSGIYVLESKNYSGWIFGNENDKNWMQVLNKNSKNKFYNPIRQNAGHISAIEKLLGNDYKGLCRNLVVFSNRSTLKDITIVSPDVVVTKRDRLRQTIVERLGRVLSAFTGEHVGEPRLVICLYGPPLLHVDFKFVSLEDIAVRVEEPVILWERNNAITNNLRLGEAKFPIPNLQWIEDRFWVWVHYGATKIGRNEIFEAIEFISFMRQVVIGPLLLMKNGKLPRGVRRIEFDAPEDLPLLLETIPTHSAQSCIEALQVIIKLYIDLREYHITTELIKRTEAEKYSKDYVSEVIEKLK